MTPSDSLTLQAVRRFLVSPLNARKQLTAFIQGAKKELLIYDMKIADRAMTRLLEERAKAGVEVRIIGKVTRKTNGLALRKLNGMRLHTRTIIRDRSQMFIGSQSLRELELDARREIGIILPDRKDHCCGDQGLRSRLEFGGSLQQRICG